MKYCAFLFACSLIAGCGDDGGAATPDASVSHDAAPDAVPDAPPPLTDRCTTNITTAGSFVELCAIPAGTTAKHVRIAGLKVPATHASAQVVFGFAALPTDAQAALEPDQVRVLFYGGGPAGPTTLAPIAQVSFGSVTETLAGDTSFITAGADVCFDLHDGSATTAPRFALWVTGQKGADCATPSTLTIANTFAQRSLWHGATGTVDKATKVYFRQAAGITATPSVTQRDAAVLTDAAIAAAAQCTTTATAASTDWQPLCTNAAGPTRFVKMTGAASTSNNNYFYTIIGQDPAPTGSPAQATGKLIVTGGKSSSGTSWTYFRFNNGSTGQFSYANTTGALYTDAPSTVCYDLGSNDDNGNLRVVFWATGAGGADCSVRSTLTLANALYDSTTDATTGTIWNAPLVTGKLDFMKISNTGAAIQSVELSSEPAVLE